MDGNNWYHALRIGGIPDLGRLDYGLISRKLVRSRTWLATRYYVGRVPQVRNLRLYAEQRRFLARLLSTDPRISVHLGRIEFRTVENLAARELDDRLSRLHAPIDPRDRRALQEIVRRHQRNEIAVEKAVDVMLAIDMVMMAERQEFEVAYLLSADGDFTPAVEAVRSRGRKTFGVSPTQGGRLGGACDAYIRLDLAWFPDCYRRL